MWKWFAIIGAGAAVGYAAVYFALSGGPATEPQAGQSTASASQPPEPMLLSQVVEVTETDSLLDPQPGLPSGVPFDPTEPLEPRVNVNATATPAIAPMPRPVD